MLKTSQHKLEDHLRPPLLSNWKKTDGEYESCVMAEAINLAR